MGDFRPFDQDDEDDVGDEYEGLSALDYAYSGGESDEDSGLDVFEAETFGATVALDAAEDDGGGLDALDTVGDDELEVPLFGVTNPPGTVTVTTYMDGRVQQIDLSPKVINMTETDLAEEILVIADLAAQDARSAQYSLILEGMREQGHDDFATRDFLTRDLHLPTPDEVDSVRAQVFSTRYGADNG